MDSGFAAQEIIETTPDHHPQRGGCTQYNGEDGQDCRVQNQSADHHCQRRNEEHGKHRSPELLWIEYDFLLEEPKPGREQEPSQG